MEAKTLPDLSTLVTVDLSLVEADDTTKQCFRKCFYSMKSYATTKLANAI